MNRIKRWFAWAKPVKRIPTILPDYGSTVSCPACGSGMLNRTYDDGWFAEKQLDAPFMWVTCMSCGFRCGEKLLRDSMEALL